jgi:hypothetical protein
MTTREPIPWACIEAQEDGYVTILLAYDDKEARIQLPEGKPVFDREPNIEGIWRELHQMLTALEQVEQSPEGIRSRPPSRT